PIGSCQGLRVSPPIHSRRSTARPCQGRGGAPLTASHASGHLLYRFASCQVEVGSTVLEVGVPLVPPANSGLLPAFRLACPVPPGVDDHGPRLIQQIVSRDIHHRFSHYSLLPWFKNHSANSRYAACISSDNSPIDGIPG